MSVDIITVTHTTENILRIHVDENEKIANIQVHDSTPVVLSEKGEIYPCNLETDDTMFEVYFCTTVGEAYKPLIWIDLKVNRVNGRREYAGWVLDFPDEGPYDRIMKELKESLDKRTPTVDQIAAKHSVEPSEVEKQLKRGIKVEREHTTSSKTAREIALDHLGEEPDYYERLLKAHLEEDNEQNNEYLYHATYRPLLKSIEKHGLGGSGAVAKWEDSEPGVVYLATSPEVAESYAESSEIVPEEWLDEIVILSVPVSMLDATKLHVDRNVQDNSGDTLEYHGVIPFNGIKQLKEQSSITEASGYIPSQKERNDPRWSTALTVDVTPNSIKDNARRLGSKIARDGRPPLLRK